MSCVTRRLKFVDTLQTDRGSRVFFQNHWRPFSDERGLQSLQLLAFLTAAQNVSEALSSH